jgi:hypothetical protein
MKKLLIVLAACLIGAMFLSFAIAQDRSMPMTQKNTQMGKNMMNKGGWSGNEAMYGSHAACGMMMSSYMMHTMVSSGDGGVIVMVGDKLQKYDRNLMLVKEVDVAYNMNDLSKMMGEIQRICDANQQNMQTGMMPSEQGGMMQGYQPDPKK